MSVEPHTDGMHMETITVTLTATEFMNEKELLNDVVALTLELSLAGLVRSQ